MEAKGKFKIDFKKSHHLEHVHRKKFRKYAILSFKQLVACMTVSDTEMALPVAMPYQRGMPQRRNV